MNLIERYVYDATRRLPKKQRADVSRELLAEIHDMVEAEANGKKPSDKHAHKVLVAMGSPSSLADRYQERPRYLIGPDYYEPYVTLLKTLLLVIVPIIVFVVWMSEALSANHSLFSMLVKLIGTATETSMHVLVWTTVSFVIVQKVADGQPHDHNWKPEDLPDLPTQQVITRGESSIAVAWSILAMVAVIFQIPSVYQTVSQHDTPQFFSPEMWPGWTLGLLALTIIGLAAELWKLYVHSWTRSTVGAIIVVNSITVGFFLSLMYHVETIVNPALSQLIAETLHRADAATSVELGARILIYIIIAICVWEIGEAIYKYKKGGKK